METYVFPKLKIIKILVAGLSAHYHSCSQDKYSFEKTYLKYTNKYLRMRKVNVAVMVTLVHMSLTVTFLMNTSISLFTVESVLVQLLVELHGEMSPCFVLEEIHKQVRCTFADFDLRETTACQHI